MSAAVSKFKSGPSKLRKKKNVCNIEQINLHLIVSYKILAFPFHANLKSTSKQAYGNTLIVHLSKTIDATANIHSMT